MITKPFIGLSKRWLDYEPLYGRLPELITVAAGDTAAFYIPGSPPEAPLPVTVGTKLNAGQAIAVEGSDEPGIVLASGTVTGVEATFGHLGKSLTKISVALPPDGGNCVAVDLSNDQQPSDELLNMLASLPGGEALGRLKDKGKKFHTLVVNGMDQDLLVGTAQYVVRSDMDNLNRGIDIIKKLTGIEKAILVIPQDLLQGYDDHQKAATIKPTGTRYPAGNPYMIMHQVLGQTVPAGSHWEDLGVIFISAETAASVGAAQREKGLRFSKKLTVIDKNGRRFMVQTAIGTPVGQILAALDLQLQQGDRLIAGGPMIGRALYDDTQPVQATMDALMIQDSRQIPEISDYPCINCGECVRICPANIAVNMLVRFLEASQYEEGADLYDLHSCIECGLCTFVCPARIPILQYITLAKQELSRKQAAEAVNE